MSTINYKRYQQRYQLRTIVCRNRHLFDDSWILRDPSLTKIIYMMDRDWLILDSYVFGLSCYLVDKLIGTIWTMVLEPCYCSALICICSCFWAWSVDCFTDFRVSQVENLIEVIVVQAFFSRMLLYLRLINMMVVSRLLFGGCNVSLLYLAGWISLVVNICSPYQIKGGLLCDLV